MPHYLAFWGILLGTFAFTLWRGRSDERTVAAVCLLATLATQFVIPPPQERYSYLDLELILIDLAVLAAFVAVALRSERFWPLWISGLQLTISISHVLKAIDQDLLPRAYAAAAVLWSYPILVIILIATWRSHHRRTRAPRIESPA
ncbi:hypothetical protein H9L13_03980 [Sphingomonas lutea]|uniref:Uncharacterized protein n=1 Tax=Sphingomonas lutea TaxID=1045317 RepID=A0A7G9SJN9_9SPHN|nr:hypothetical protein [Sphingomonas lutea]QNN68064.1 hypothetical protein H9L13_03980 [Sphingomonas lutea]